jgi:hypothetical protein
MITIVINSFGCQSFIDFGRYEEGEMRRGVDGSGYRWTRAIRCRAAWSLRRFPPGSTPCASCVVAGANDVGHVMLQVAEPTCVT